MTRHDMHVSDLLKTCTTSLRRLPEVKRTMGRYYQRMAIGIEGRYSYRNANHVNPLRNRRLGDAS